jgi:hypothetical protein
MVRFSPIYFGAKWRFVKSTPSDLLRTLASISNVTKTWISRSFEDSGSSKALHKIKCERLKTFRTGAQLKRQPLSFFLSFFLEIVGCKKRLLHKGQGCTPIHSYLCPNCVYLTLGKIAAQKYPLLHKFIFVFYTVKLQHSSLMQGQTNVLQSCTSIIKTCFYIIRYFRKHIYVGKTSGAWACGVVDT